MREQGEYLREQGEYIMQYLLNQIFKDYLGTD